MILFRFRAWPTGPNLFAASVCRIRGRAFFHVLLLTRSYVFPKPGVAR